MNARARSIVPGLCDFYYLGAKPLHISFYVSLIRAIREEGIDLRLMVSQRIDLRHPLAFPAAWISNFKRQIGPAQNSLRTRVIGPVPFHYRAKGLFASFLLPFALRSVFRGRTVLFQARTVHVADAVLKLKRLGERIRVVAELEGDGESELLYASEHGMGYSGLDLAKRIAADRASIYRVLSQSDIVICVTARLKSLLVSRHNLSNSDADRIVVIPTYATRDLFSFDPDQRSALRQSWGIANRFVVTYSGNLASPWQLPRETVRVFQLIREVKPSAFLLVLAPQSEHTFIAGHIERVGLAGDDYSLKSLSHSDVASALCAADVGLILRDDHVMNKVSSPGKIAEYVLCGLPVVATESVGDYARSLRGRPEVLIITDLHDTQAVESGLREFFMREISLEERERFSAWSAQHLSIEAVMPRFLDVYRKVLG